jgi:serine/threonine-protein kinase
MSSNEDHGTLPVSLARHVDQTCIRFEAAWTAGQRPRLEDFVGAVPEPARPSAVRELILLDVHYRRLAGEGPQAADYQARFPQLDPVWLARAVAARLEAQPKASAAARNSANAAEDDQNPPTRFRRIRCPHCQNPIQLSDDHGDEVLCPGCGGSFCIREAKETTTARATRPLGKFQLLERVGVGAFGAVWRARDTELDRIVALKIRTRDCLRQGMILSASTGKRERRRNYAIQASSRCTRCRRSTACQSSSPTSSTVYRSRICWRCAG